MNTTDSASPLPALVTEQQLADRLQVSTRHLINLRKAGLPYLQLGSAIRYDLAEVDAYLRTNRRLSLHMLCQQRRAALARKSTSTTGQ